MNLDGSGILIIRRLASSTRTSWSKLDRLQWSSLGEWKRVLLGSRSFPGLAGDSQRVHLSVSNSVKCPPPFMPKAPQPHQKSIRNPQLAWNSMKNAIEMTISRSIEVSISNVEQNASICVIQSQPAIIANHCWPNRTTGISKPDRYIRAIRLCVCKTTN